MIDLREFGFAGLESALAAMSSTDVELRTMSVRAAAATCRILSRMAVENLSQGGPGCIFVAESLYAFGSVITDPLKDLLSRSEDIQVRHLAATALLELDCYDGVNELLDAIVAGDYACSAAEALANAGVSDASEKILVRLRLMGPEQVDLGPSFGSNWAKDTVVCLLDALEKLKIELPDDIRAMFSAPMVPVEIRKMVERGPVAV